MKKREIQVDKAFERVPFSKCKHLHSLPLGAPPGPQGLSLAGGHLLLDASGIAATELLPGPPRTLK